jgi:hypothetical protein
MPTPALAGIAVRPCEAVLGAVLGHGQRQNTPTRGASLPRPEIKPGFAELLRPAIARKYFLLSRAVQASGRATGAQATALPTCLVATYSIDNCRCAAARRLMLQIKQSDLSVLPGRQASNRW